jgi:hypothetical protein
MRFSPLLVSSLIIEPLRYFFENYAKESGLVWDEDEKIRTIEIDSENNYNTISTETNPRILINRGSFRIGKTGISDNLAESNGIYANKGQSNRTNLVFITGQARITIEAAKEGTCELIADMVSHFLIWSVPFLCSSQNFKEFGIPMEVSECQPDKENVEKFKIVISIPYMMEEDWVVRQDSMKLKDFFLTVN